MSYRVPLVLLLALGLLARPVFPQGERADIVVQVGHAGMVQSLATDPEGALLAGGGEDGRVSLWDLRTRKLLRMLPKTRRAVTGVAFSADGKQLAAGDEEGWIRLWDVTTGAELRRWRALGGRGEVRALAVSARGIIAGGGGSPDLPGSAREIELWKAENGERLGVIPVDFSVEALAFTPDGAQLLGGGLRSQVYAWDMATRRLTRTYAGPRAGVNDLAVSPDGRLVAAAGEDGRARVWKVTGEPAHTFRHEGTDNGVAAVCFSPDGSLLVSGGWGLNDSANLTRVWEIRTGRELFSLSAGAYCLAAAPDGRTLAAGVERDIVLYDLRRRERVGALSGRWNLHAALAYSPDGSVLAAGDEAGAIRIWDTAACRLRFALPAHEERVMALAISPDGRTLAGSGWDSTVKLWDLAGGRLIRTHELEHPASVLRFSPDGKSLAAGGGSVNKGVLIVWDAVTGKERFTAGVEKSEITCLAYSPDGAALAGGGDLTRRVQVWNASTGAPERSFTAADRSGVHSLAYAGDGRTLVGGGWLGTVELWEAASGRSLQQVSDGPPHAVVALSPDSRSLAVAADNVVRLWALPEMRLVWTRELDADVCSLLFRPDGAMLAAGAQQDTTQLLSAGTGEPVATLLGLTGEDYLVAGASGYYCGTRTAARGIAFRVGSRAFPGEQFDLRYNRPDQVLPVAGRPSEGLLAACRTAYARRLARMGVSEAALSDDHHAPRLEILTRELPLTTDERLFRFRIRADDSRCQLGRLSLSINDSPVYGAGGLDLRPLQVRSHEQDLELELLPGLNTIQVSVLNEKGVESLKQVLRITCGAPSRRPDLYVLSVGVSQYPRPENRLQYADKDAADFAAYWGTRRSEFGEAQVIRLLNHDATRERILQARETLRRSRPEDLVLVFLAGHGLLDPQFRYFFGAVDVDFARPEQGGLSYDELESLLDRVPARRKLLFMDTCHAGEVEGVPSAPERASTPVARNEDGTVRQYRAAGARGARLAPGVLEDAAAELLRETFLDLRRGAGGVVIASAGGAEAALEGPRWKNGVFTYAMLRGLTSGSADRDGDGTVTVRELRESAAGAVRLLTGGQQQPTSRRESDEHDFALARSPGLLQAWSHGAAVRSLAFNPDGRSLASSGEDNAVRLWGTGAGEPRRTLRLPGSQRVPAVAFSGSGRVLASGGREAVVMEWDPTSGKAERQVRGGWDVYLAAFSPDRTRLARYWPEGPIELWDVKQGKETRALSVPKSSTVRRLSFSPDGRVLAAILNYRSVALWEVETGKSLAAPETAWEAAGAVTLSPDGRTLAIGVTDRTVKLFDARTGAPAGALAAGSGEAAVIALAYSPDGRYLAAGCEDGTTLIWETADGRLLGTRRGHPRFVDALAFAPDGALLATGGREGGVRLWSVAGMGEN